MNYLRSHHNTFRFSALLFVGLISGSVLLTSCSGESTSSSNKVNVTNNVKSNRTPADTAPAATPVQRVIALSSITADIVHELAPEKLVGITGSRLLAKNPALADVPKVAEGRTPPNLEQILALKPDLVIGATGFHDQPLKQLQQSGIPTLATELNSWESLNELTKTIATAIGADPAPLLSRYQSWITVKSASQPQPSVLVLAGKQPIMTPNKASWTGDLLTRLGINNITADLQKDSPMRGYVTLSPENILSTDPDTLIVVDTGDGAIDSYKASPFWNQLKAVKENRVHVFDYYGLINAGSINAIQTASQQLKQEILLQ